MSKETDTAVPTAEELGAARVKYAQEHELPEEMAQLLTGETEAAIEASAKLAAAILKLSAPKEEPKKDAKGGGQPDATGKPAAGQNGFQPEKLAGLLDVLTERFGEDAVTAYLSQRLGVDEIKKTLSSERMESTRSKMALEYKLTPEQVAKIPGNTPEELAGAAKALAEITEDLRKSIPEGSHSGQPGIPFRTTSGGGSRKPQSLEEAEAAFDNVGTAADRLR